MADIVRATLRKLRLPLYQPYKLAYRTFTEFEPFLLELEGSDGRLAFADGHVSPGSSSETREGAWAYSHAMLERLKNEKAEAIMAQCLDQLDGNNVATTLLLTAMESFRHSPWLDIEQDASLELIVPINATEEGALEEELATLTQEGFTTFKVKVGKDVEGDIERANAILRILDGRATIRLDANRSYSKEDAIRFITSLRFPGADLFEQPCDTDAWDDNAAVAQASPVPLMLDEPICTLRDIERAAAIPNVGYCKVKLKRFGSLDALAKGIQHIHAHDMQAVLGDGLGSEINNWMEACIAARLIHTKGEFNGFLKHIDKLFENPLVFHKGRLELKAGYVPSLDQNAVERLTVEKLVVDY